MNISTNTPMLVMEWQETSLELSLGSGNRLDEDKQKQLSQFLNETRFTVVCEILIPTQQHVVQLDHLTESELYVLSMTDVPFHDTKTLLAAPTDVTLRMFEDLGFKVPLHDYLQLQDLNNDIKRIRNATNTEGVVYYFQDSEGHTTGLLKIKSIWYISSKGVKGAGLLQEIGC